VGASIEGSVISSRPRINEGFYGGSLTARQLLLEAPKSHPLAASLLYTNLQQFFVTDRLQTIDTERVQSLN